MIKSKKQQHKPLNKDPECNDKMSLSLWQRLAILGVLGTGVAILIGAGIVFYMLFDSLDKKSLRVVSPEQITPMNNLVLPEAGLEVLDVDQVNNGANVLVYSRRENKYYVYQYQSGKSEPEKLYIIE